jgi:hypothetical protein
MPSKKVVHCYEEEGRKVIHTVYGDRTETFRFDNGYRDYWEKLFQLEREGYITYEEESI